MFLCILLGACAHQPGEASIVVRALPAPKTTVDQEGNYWWYARFQIKWDGEQRPDFSKDLILAHEVLAPLLAHHADEILLWRFHRRAARDAAGHQFSFIFYSTPEAARAIYADIGSNPVVKVLLKSDELVAVKLDDTTRPQRAAISATSDHNWPAAVQKSWPYFIMGVSLMWLDLVEQTVDPHALASRRGIRDRLEYYKKINARITALWMQVGRHAMFHHISAIYGYEPLEILF